MLVVIVVGCCWMLLLLFSFIIHLGFYFLAVLVLALRGEGSEVIGVFSVGAKIPKKCQVTSVPKQCRRRPALSSKAEAVVTRTARAAAPP